MVASDQIGTYRYLLYVYVYLTGALGHSDNFGQEGQGAGAGVK